MNRYGVSLDSGQRRLFGQAPLVGRHRLYEARAFSDEALIALLDRHPREHVDALTMGSDPERIDENRLALHDGLSGSELLEAVKRGRLWLNVRHLDEYEPHYAEITHDLYVGLTDQIPWLVADTTQTTLRISSPHALVYYQVGGAPSLLWHVRGEMRLWMYPALDERFVARETLEDIFAGVAHEYVPYDPRFDNFARTHVLKPGEFACWPQNAPHRITNNDTLSVSLSTVHFTPESRRRARVYCANRFLRTRLRLPVRSTRETGAVAFGKIVVHRTALELGLDKRRAKSDAPTLRVDPNAPLGVTSLFELRA